MTKTKLLVVACALALATTSCGGPHLLRAKAALNPSRCYNQLDSTYYEEVRCPDVMPEKR